MSLPNDLSPERCLELVAESIQSNIEIVLANLPDINDSNEEASRKYVILGRSLRKIREYTREGLKAVQFGSDSTAINLIEAGKHKPLTEFSEEKEPGGDGIDSDSEEASMTIEIDGEEPVTINDPLKTMEKAIKKITEET